MTTPADTIGIAAEAVRDANHLTLRTEAVPDHSGLYASVGETERLVAGLPQLLEQLARAADACAGLDVDEMTDQEPGDLARHAGEQLRRAALAIRGITSSPIEHLASAHAAISHFKTPR